MKKRILSIALCAVLMLATPVFAGSASTEVDDYSISVDCTQEASNHSVVAHGNATYPMGSALVKYTYRGRTLEAYPGGTSSSPYWQASFKVKAEQTIYSASTTGYGSTVTAFP